MARACECHRIGKRRLRSNRIQPGIALELLDTEVALLDRGAESEHAEPGESEPRVEPGHPQDVLAVRESRPDVQILRVDTRGDVQRGDGVLRSTFQVGAKELAHRRDVVAPRDPRPRLARQFECLGTPVHCRQRDHAELDVALAGGHSSTASNSRRASLVNPMEVLKVGIERDRGLMRGDAGIEESAEPADEHEAGVDLRLGLPHVQAAQQPAERLLGSARVRLELSVVIVRLRQRRAQLERAT